jgi:hypothetical protein
MLRERDDERHHDLDRFGCTFMSVCHGDGLESLGTNPHNTYHRIGDGNIYTGLALSNPSDRADLCQSQLLSVSPSDLSKPGVTQRWNQSQGFRP